MSSQKRPPKKKSLRWRLATLRASSIMFLALYAASRLGFGSPHSVLILFGS